jgi:acyl carrier protein
VNDDEILAGVRAVAREHLGYGGELEPGMRLVEDLELDSIRLLTLAMEVENRFRVRLEEADEAAIETVGDLVAAVRRKLADPARAADGAAGDRAAEEPAPQAAEPTAS